MVVRSFKLLELEFQICFRSGNVPRETKGKCSRKMATFPGNKMVFKLRIPQERFPFLYPVNIIPFFVPGELKSSCVHIHTPKGLSQVRESGCTDTGPGCGYNLNCEDKVRR